MGNFLTDVCEIVKGDFLDYKKLKQYHYIQDDPVCLRGVWKIRPVESYARNFPDPLAVIVYVVPIREWITRKVATDNYFGHWPRGGVRLSVINKNVTYLSRLIVDPRFFKQGLGSYLLTETLKLQPVPLVETMTPADFTTEMFLKAGFERYYQPTPLRYSRCQNALLAADIPKNIWHIPEMVQLRIDSLPPNRHAVLHKEIKDFLSSFHHHENSTPCLSRTRYLLSKIFYPNIYLLWHNPGMLLPRLPA